MLDINAPKIEAELRDLVDHVPRKEGESDKPHRNRVKVKVRLNKSQDIALRTRETDQSIEITFNPKRYRTEAKLEGHLNDLRQDMVWGS